MRLVGVLSHQAPRAPASRMAAADERWATNKATKARPATWRGGGEARWQRPAEEGHSLIRRRTSSMRISSAVSSRREVRDEDGSRQRSRLIERTDDGAAPGAGHQQGLLMTETATHRRFLPFWMIPVASERVADPLPCSRLRLAFSNRETVI